MTFVGIENVKQSVDKPCFNCSAHLRYARRSRMAPLGYSDSTEADNRRTLTADGPF